ncbi:MAG: hypothetical protein ABH811_02870 [archaeon]
MKKRILILLEVFVLSLITVSAFQAGHCVTAEITDISPTSIKIGEEFTVGVLIDNCGEVIPKEVIFELIDISPNIEVKEPLRKDIGQMGYSNSERFLLYHMKVNEDASPGEYKFNYKLNYDFVLKEGSFSVNVIGAKAKLNIASFKTKPVLPYKDETVELTLRIENFGDGTANSIKILLDHPFQGIKESFIGTLDSSEDGPAIFTFIANKVGEFEIPITIFYSDDFGENEITSSVKIIILKNVFNWTGLIVSLVLVVFSVWFVIHYFNTKRKKDTIIKQLLEGKDLSMKKLKKPKK